VAGAQAADQDLEIGPLRADVGPCDGRQDAALASERAVEVRRSPVLYLLLEPLREILVGLLWPVPFVSRKVAWRGQAYRIGRRTLLAPLNGDLDDMLDDLETPMAVESAAPG